MTFYTPCGYYQDCRYINVTILYTGLGIGKFASTREELSKIVENNRFEFIRQRNRRLSS